MYAVAWSSVIFKVFNSYLLRFTSDLNLGSFQARAPFLRYGRRWVDPV